MEKDPEATENLIHYRSIKTFKMARLSSGTRDGSQGGEDPGGLKCDPLSFTF